MSKKLFGKVFIFLLVVGLLFAVAPTGQALAQSPSVWDGNYPGTKPAGMLDPVGGVQEVHTAAEFAWLASQTTMFEPGVTTVKLMVDIDLNNSPWTPSVALSGSNVTLDGNGHTITKLKVEVDNSVLDGTYYAAMFTSTYTGWVTIQNLTIDGAVVGPLYPTRNRVNSAVLLGIDDVSEYGITFNNVTIKNATVNGTKYVAAIEAYGRWANFTGCTVQNVILNVNEQFKSDGVTRDLPHIGSLVGLDNAGQATGNTISNLAINFTPVSGQTVDTAQTGTLIGTAQSDVLVGSNDISGVTLNGVPYTKIIGLDQRTYKVVNTTKLLGYTTIQAAIDAADAGNVIEAGAGTYNEALVINKAITLTGAGDDVTIIDGTGLTGATLVSAPNLTSGALSISGFTFKDDPTSTAPLTYLVSIGNCQSPATASFTDNTIIGTGSSDYDWGLLVQGGNCAHTIKNNLFDNVGGNSILIETATGDVEIGYNTFLVPDGNEAPAIWSMSYGTELDPHTVTGLHWYHHNTIQAKVDGGIIRGGIGFAPAYGNGWNVRQYGSYKNVLVEYNTIEDFYSSGIQVEVDGANSTFNGVIQNNTLTPAPSQIYSNGIRLLGPVDGTSLLSNIVTGAQRGIYLSGTWSQPIYPTDIKIEKNQLAGNVSGLVEIDTALDQDASPNWWGSASGPAEGYLVSNLDYIPWCANAICTEFAGPVTNITQHTGYATIQAAITDADPGDTITVAAGTYNEVITINKAVTLLGPNAGISPITGTRSAEAIITSTNTTHNVMVRSSGVRIEGFKFANSASTNVIWADSKDSPNNNFVFKSNLLVNNSGPIYLGAGPSSGWQIIDNKIESTAGSSTSGLFLVGLSNSTISGNWIQNTTYAGMLLDSLTNSTVSGNTIKNVPGVGIQIANASGSVNIYGNVIDNAGQVLLENDKGGIRLYGSALTGAIDIHDNTITNSYNGIGTRNSSTCDLTYIDIYENNIAMSNDVQVYNGCTNGSVLDATENWWGQETGPVAGKIVGNVASCAWLDAAPPAGEPVAYPVTNTTTHEGFCTIQAAIDDADTDDEDIITVAAGTYAEAVDINKSLTLLGPNANLSPNTDDRLQEATFVATSDLPGDYPGLGAINLQGHDLIVTVKGFDFNLEGTSDPDYRYINVVNDDRSTLHVENCIFRNAPETDNGYWWFTDAAGPHTVTILDNHFLNGGVSNGIQWGGNSFIVDIQDNVWEDNQGYAMNFNNATGTISGNQFIDRVDNGPEWSDDQLGMLFAGGGNDLDITGNTFDQVPEAAILMSYTFASKLDISGNTFMRSPGVVDTDWGYFIIQNSGDYSNVSIIKNSFLLDEFSHTWTNETPFDLTYNYWGSPCGPSNIVGVGPIEYAPWYADEDMTILREENVSGDVTFVPTMSTLEMNSIIACAEPNSIITFTTTVGDVEYPGGIIIPEGREHLDFILNDGVKIIANSPCFTVEADYTTIEADNIGMAACVTAAGSNGIDVADGVVNLTVDGLEIYGEGDDGIHFNGTVTDIVLVNNYIHDLDKDGIYFHAQPQETYAGEGQDIQGNLFKGNGGFGINNPNGTADIEATYNSWGVLDGPEATGGDGVSDHVAFDPWTHADISMVSSGTPWANTVVKGNTIIYTIQANLMNVNTADFVVQYPDELSYEDVDYFDVLVELKAHNEDSNTLTFRLNNGSNINPNPASDVNPVNLVSITFTGATNGINKPLTFPGASFGMAGYDSSNNVYTTAVTDSSVSVIDLPTISSPDLPGYYLTGQEQAFRMGVINPETGQPYTNVMFKITVSGAELTDIISAKYEQTWPDPLNPTWVDFVFDDTSANLVAWYGMVDYGGFGMPAPDDQGLQNFLINFVNAGDYPILVELWEMDGTVVGTPYSGYEDHNVNKLAEASYTMVVYNTPVITENGLTGNHKGLTQSFTINFDDMSTMVDPYTITPITPITFLAHLDLPEGTVLTYPGGTVTCGASGCSFPVTLSAGANPISLTATFLAPFNGAVTVSLYDSLANPDRLLNSEEFEPVVVYQNIASVIATISMQGRSTRAGADMILTGPTTGTDPVVPFAYGPYTGTSFNQISNNTIFTDLAGTIYTITTYQDRYLRLTADLGKTINVELYQVIAPLQLMGGNAQMAFGNHDGNLATPAVDVIDLDDASQVGTDYGNPDDLDPTTLAGDVNFDLVVDVLDLALVGGNYGKTSADAYGDWEPVLQ